MQTSKRRQLSFNITAVILSLCLAVVLLWWSLPFVRAQGAEKDPGASAPPASSGATNSPSRAPADAGAPSTNAPSTNAPARRASIRDAAASNSSTDKILSSKQKETQ